MNEDYRRVMMQEDYGMSRTIEVYTEADIGDFDDDAILAEALDVIQRHRLVKVPDQGTGAYSHWANLREAVGRIATELGTPVCEDVLPASTAGRIRTMEALKAEIDRNWSH